MVGEYLVKNSFYFRKIKTDSGGVQLINFNHQFNLEGVTMSSFTFAAIILEKMGGLKSFPNAE